MAFESRFARFDHVKWSGLFLVLALCSCQSDRQQTSRKSKLERIEVAPNQPEFIRVPSNQVFHPWGLNYGNHGRLMEDFWDTEWQTIADDFAEMRALGANVVRVHLQFGRFMKTPSEPNKGALAKLRELVRLAERIGIYLDITGLACYRPKDVPAWYDEMDEPARWDAQANFWEAVAEACANSPAVFCYDLINEPISPGQRREPAKWPSGSLFGGYDFLQYIALEPAGRKREEIAAAWIKRMTAAIREHDKQTLITVGLLPWSRQWKHLSGFLPDKIAPELDFISVHIYPDTKKPGEALEALERVSVGKPVVIEETFPLSCGAAELENFLRESRTIACGWIGHYDGQSLDELDSLDRAGKLSIAQSIYRAWLRMFFRLAGEF